MGNLNLNARALRHHFWGAPQTVNWNGLSQSLVADGLIDSSIFSAVTRDLLTNITRPLDVGSIKDAGQGDVSLLNDRQQFQRWQRAVDQNAQVPAVLVVHRDLAAQVAGILEKVGGQSTAVLASPYPKVLFGRIIEVLYPKAVLGWAVEDFETNEQTATAMPTFPGARIADTAAIGEGVRIAAGAVIGRGAKIGRHCIVGPNATIGAGVVLGERCTVGPGARIFASWAGDDCDFRSNAVVGERGYGVTLAPLTSDVDGYQSYNMPQIAGVRLGSRCEVRHGSVVDRGALDDTVLGDDVHIDSQATIGHGSRLGDRVSVGALAGTAGQAVVGNDCLLLARSGVLEGREIAARTTLLMDCIVTKPFLKPGQALAGNPAMPAEAWNRREAYLNRLAKKALNS